MAATRLKKVPALLAIIIYLATPTIYFGIEWYSSKMFVPYYSYISRFTSDLGIPYAYDDPETGHLINSWRAVMMNLNFAANGFLFLAGQICLLRATGQKTYSTARIIVAVLYCIGIILVAVVAGGPKEHESGSVVWHGVGAGLAIFGGNINSILAAYATPSKTRPVYRTGSLLLGTGGLCGLGIFFLFNKGGMKGFWQRSSIYPTQLWEYFTAFSLIYELWQQDDSVKTD